MVDLGRKQRYFSHSQVTAFHNIKLQCYNRSSHLNIKCKENKENTQSIFHHFSRVKKINYFNYIQVIGEYILVLKASQSIEKSLQQESKSSWTQPRLAALHGGGDADQFSKVASGVCVWLEK